MTQTHRHKFRQTNTPADTDIRFDIDTLYTQRERRTETHNTHTHIQYIPTHLAADPGRPTERESLVTLKPSLLNGFIVEVTEAIGSN